MSLDVSMTAINTDCFFSHQYRDMSEYGCVNRKKEKCFPFFYLENSIEFENAKEVIEEYKKQTVLYVLSLSSFL